MLGAAVFVVAAGPLYAAKRTIIDRAGVIVNDKIVTMQEVSTQVRLQESDVRRRYKGEELAEKLKTLRSEVIDGIIESLLLEAKAEQLGIQVTEKEIDGRVDQIVQRDPRITSVYSDSQLKEFVVKDILRKRVIQREVSAKLVVRAEVIKSACLKESAGGRELDVAHILLRGDSAEVRDRLLDLRGELEGGAAFSELAQRHSQDPQASENKGRLGFISRGQFFKSFEDAAFALKVGELSQPVKTKFGYHLIKIYGERSKSKVDCDEIAPATRRRLRDKIWNAQRASKMKRFLSQLRNKAEIIIFDRNGALPK